MYEKIDEDLFLSEPHNYLDSTQKKVKQLAEDKLAAVNPPNPAPKIKIRFASEDKQQNE